MEVGVGFVLLRKVECFDRRRGFSQRRNHSWINSINRSSQIGGTELEWVCYCSVESSAEFVDRSVPPMSDVSDDVSDDVEGRIGVVHWTRKHCRIVTVDSAKVMACEHGQNLSVEPLHSAANSSLRIPQRPLDLVEITGHIISFNRSPSISHLDDTSLQVGQHRRYRRQLSRIVRRIRLLRSHVSRSIRVFSQTGPGGVWPRTSLTPPASALGRLAPEVVRHATKPHPPLPNPHKN